MSKQIRLTLPDAEADSICKQATDEGFETPQQLILHRLRRFNELQAEVTTLEAKQKELEQVLTSKTDEVLAYIKDNRHELLMLYAFRVIFPKVPEAVALVMDAYNLTPGVFYMRHVCENFPKYVDQINEAARKITATDAENKQLKAQVTNLEGQLTELEQKLTDAQSLKSALDVVLRDDTHLEELCQRLHIRLIGNEDFQKAVDYMMEFGGTTRHQDYVSRALRSYHVYKRKDVEGQLKSAEALISKNVDEIADLKRERDFYKDKSWLRKLWESLGGQKQLPTKTPRKVEDDDIPF